jgi:hypothetical protein
VAVADSYSIAEDGFLVVGANNGVLANDTDADGDPLTAQLVSGTANGTLNLNANGSFTYRPNANFFGTDTFRYRASDGQDVSNTVTVTIVVTPVNDPPVAVNDSYNAPAGGALSVAAPGVLANDLDVDGDVLTAVLVSGPTNGTLTLNANGSFVYTPNAGYTGPDSFRYRASDGALTSNIATVNLVVNHVPVALPDVYVTNKQAVLAITNPAQGVLANDTDADGNPLTAVLVSGPANGTLTFNPNGTFTYTPTGTFTGVDTFRYKVNDTFFDSNTVTVTIRVNSPPTANADTYTTKTKTPLTIGAPGVLANDFDPEGDPLQAVLVTPPMFGSLTFNADGSFTYMPVNNFLGTDTFQYRVTDGRLFSPPALVSIVVTPLGANNPPQAGNDSFLVVNNGQPLFVGAPGVLANDSDPEGQPLTAHLLTGPANGLLIFNGNGSFTYTPNQGFVGTDTFTYRAFDGAVFSLPATVTFTVIHTPNQPPVAVNDSYTGAYNQPLMVTAAAGVLANDTDAEGDPLTAELVAGPTQGSLALNSDGSFLYQPPVNFVGTVTFTYRARDAMGASNVATVALIFPNPSNFPPEGTDDAYAVKSGQTLTVAAPGVLANDSDLEGQALTAVLASGPSHGTLTLNDDGSFVYTPLLGYVGIDSFTYRPHDGMILGNVTVVVIEVQPPNRAPVAVADSYTVHGGVPTNIAAPGVLANDFDPDGDLLWPVLVTGPANGTLTLNDDGSFLYQSNPTFVGTDTFSYRATDGSLDSAVVEVTIVVNPAPGGPEQTLVVAPGSGLEPRVRVFDGRTQAEKFNFLAYPATYLGGVRVATADVTSDGVPDIITAPAGSMEPRVRVFDGRTGEPLPGVLGNGILAYAANYRGGVSLAVGDFNGDGVPDIVTAPTGGTGSQVRIFDGLTGLPLPGVLGGFTAYATGIKNGIRVAVGDENGDGTPDIITVPGAGTAPLVKVFSGAAGQAKGTPPLLRQFSAFAAAMTRGMEVTAGDLDGDGRTEIVVAAGAGTAGGSVGEVRVFSRLNTPARTLTPFGAGASGGVRVSVGDLNGDGRLDLLFGTGTGLVNRVRPMDYATLADLYANSFNPFGPAFSGGLHLAGLRRLA